MPITERLTEREERAMATSRQPNNPGGSSEKKIVVEEKVELQLLQDTQQDIMLKIADIHSLREFVKNLPVTVMRPIHADHLESLVHSDLKLWPPIFVTLTNIGYICFDGLHRVQAAKVRQLETIPARSVSFKTMNDLIEATFRANLSHGLRASTSTRSEYCYWLSITYPNLSQRQIATRVGVAQSTVSRAIEQHQKEQQPGSKEAVPVPEQAEEAREKQAQEFTKSTGRFLKSASGILKMIPKEEYDDFIWNLQVELLNSSEDRVTLLRTGQLLIDVAKAKRKARQPVAADQQK
jgi:hypothetical protein